MIVIIKCALILRARYYAKHFKCIILFEFHKNPLKSLSPLYKWENLVKKLSNLPKVMMLSYGLISEYFYHLY